MNHQAAIIKAAKRLNKDTTELSEREYAQIRIAVRTMTELAVDGFNQKKAQLKEYIGIGLVPEPVALQNLEGCRGNTCGSYGKLVNGVEVCHRCNCMGNELLTKVRQGNEFCPALPPVWDNRTVLTIKATDGKPD